MRKNAFTHTPRLGVVWDSKHDICMPSRRAHCTVLPTKTSLQCIHCTGISPSFLRAGSQVSSTRFINSLVLVIFRVVTLSIVSLSLIAQCHLALISPSDRAFSCMTLSHHRTYIMYADSDRRIWRSQVGPLCAIFRCCL